MNTLQNLFDQLASIEQMERGTLSFLRQTSKGPSANFQRWSGGRHFSEYIPADQVPIVQENLEAYARFQNLIDQYVQGVALRSREQRLEGVKKKRANRSPSPRKPKSKT